MKIRNIICIVLCLAMTLSVLSASSAKASAAVWMLMDYLLFLFLCYKVQFWEFIEKIF